jgi:hypothetical protein
MLDDDEARHGDLLASVRELCRQEAFLQGLKPFDWSSSVAAKAATS